MVLAIAADLGGRPGARHRTRPRGPPRLDRLARRPGRRGERRRDSRRAADAGRRRLKGQRACTGKIQSTSPERVMGDISRTALFGKLNSVAYKAIEGATVFCKLRGNPYVEVVHWIHQILQLQGSDVHAIVRAFNLDPGKIARDVTETLDRLPRGATSISDLSPHIEDAVERAWVWATLKYGDTQVRTGYVVLAMLKTPTLRNVLLSVTREFEKIKPEQLTD